MTKTKDFEPGSQYDDEYAICPHCGEKHDDCWDWVKEDVREDTCQKCGKKFKYWSEISVSYCTEKAE